MLDVLADHAFNEVLAREGTPLGKCARATDTGSHFEAPGSGRSQEMGTPISEAPVFMFGRRDGNWVHPGQVSSDCRCERALDLLANEMLGIDGL